MVFNNIRRFYFDFSVLSGLKIVFFVLVFLFPGNPVSAKDRSVEVFVKWGPNETIRLRNGSFSQILWFEDAVTKPSTGLLPWFEIELKVEDGFKPENIQLDVLGFLPGEIKEQDFFSDLALIPEDFEWRIEEIKAEGTSKFYLHILPLRMSEGSIDKLLEAVVSFEEHTNTDSKEATETVTFAENSVLSLGQWVRLGVTETGIYKIGYNDLVAMGFNPDLIDPRQIGLFGNGGRMLPEQNNQFRYDDLFENAIKISGEEDGVFNAEDEIYFYAQGPVVWNYSGFNSRFIHVANYYTDTTYYFITVKTQEAGKRIQDKEQSELNSNFDVETFLDRVHHEQDLENLIHSGKEWFGETFSRNDPSMTWSFDFPNRVTERPIMFNTHFAGRSITENIYLSAEANDKTLFENIMLMQLSANNATYARDNFQSVNFTDESDQINITFNLTAQSDNSKAWLNYFRLNVWRYLKYHSGQPLHFRNPETVVSNMVGRFRIQDVDSDLFLWDVTHPLVPSNQMFDVAGSDLTFKVKTDSLREYVLFNPTDAKNILSFKSIPNQNLHSINSGDMLIVAHPDFISNANEIAEIHFEDDGLISVVVNIDDIYNEFGSGSKDITALRDFVRMVYLKSDKQLKYLLLFGSASYDYKDRIPNNTNFVPTYQSTGALVETQSFVSDDYFGLMDANEGLEMDGVLDIGIGRFPVASQAEAQTMVNKVRHYLAFQRSQTGEWRNNVLFVADDGDNNLHLQQAETLSAIVDTAFVTMNVRKLYLDSYKRISVAGGFRFPDANTALVNQINEGALIVNYTGHGGIAGLSDERVFTGSDIASLKNYDRMPFFITATCEFSRFDNPAFVSAGEQLLLNPAGGSIAIMTTTRLAFAHSNFAINRRIYSSMFSEGKGEIRRLGDIIRLSKNPTNTYVYNFVLLGDPALRLKYPDFKVEPVKFNSQLLPYEGDTLGAMSEIVIEGRILDADGSFQEDFNGYIYPKMFDKKAVYKTLANDASSNATNFAYFDKLLFKGNSTVTDGEFDIRFKLPRNIAYQYGQAKLSFYAVDTVTFKDAGGYFNQLIVGGTDESVSIDNIGPEIKLYADNPDFKNGDYLTPDPIIHIKIEDPQGVNFLGNSIGRDIVITHESENLNKYIVNHLFQPDFDNFAGGKIVFPLSNLADGKHRISVKAWDLHNNSSENEIWFEINPKDELKIWNLRNAPNPFNNSTQIRFEHNKPGETLDVTIDIFNQVGAMIGSLKNQMITFGSQSIPIELSLKDVATSAILPGFYVYRLSVSDDYGNKIQLIQKMIVIRNQ
jgi:hypothetical protein